MATIQLLGPPEIHHQKKFPTKQNPSTTKTLPPVSWSTSFLPTFSTAITTITENPCHDFFFNVPSHHHDGKSYLQEAWNHDAVTTLKLICNLRSVQHKGKLNKEGFFTAVLWLHKNHPLTLACNLKVFVKFGYLKDLLEILYRLLEGNHVRLLAKQGWENKKKEKAAKMRRCRCHDKRRKRKFKRVKMTRGSREERILADKEKGMEDKEKASVLRKERKVEMARKAMERYRSDLDYRFLHDRISDLFAELLKADIGYLNNGKIDKISMAAKWCPSLDSSYDKATLICESIAKRVFPREAIVEYQGIEEAHYVYRVRDRLRKQVLVPLRKALQLPEVYMSANQWDLIPYDKISSLAMKRYRNHFLKHDNKRLREYLDNVKSEKETKSLLPHKIVAPLFKKIDDTKVAEAQWRRIVDEFSKKGKLQNCIAICDVSSSMRGIPIEVGVALSILVSELSDDPWKGKVITFSEKPQLLEIEGDDLSSKISFVRHMDCGRNIDLKKVFQEIFHVATEERINKSKMIKRVFVFTDMEFREACQHHDWEMEYREIQRKFRYNCFKKVPEIVFWNLGSSVASPKPSKRDGVAMINGFSTNLLISFLEEGGVLSQDAMMQSAISGEEYKELIVFD